jgi:uncharacterized membrane protein YdbT with pleckstrin-like domain
MRATAVAPFLVRFAPELSGALDLAERPPRRALRRYLTRPLLAAAVLAVALVVVVPALWPLTLVLLALGAAAGYDAYNIEGLSVDGPRVVVRAWSGGSSVTLVARRRRLQSHALSCSPLQRRAGLMTLSVTVARGSRLDVRHLEQPRAQRAFDAL